MKKNSFLVWVMILLAAQICAVFLVLGSVPETQIDTVKINECVRSVEENFGNEENYSDSLKYVVTDTEGNLLYKNGEGLSESVNEGIKNSDTVMEISPDGVLSGRIIIHNDLGDRLKSYRVRMFELCIFFAVLSSVSLLVFFAYLKRSILDPFERLDDFAARVAGGNLDLPLEMDKGHVFGAFSEAFDLMRSELKKARLAEKKANDDKKEVIAKLSHDIKTPVASIKSTSELGMEVSQDEKTRERFALINGKSDQINALVTNLFHSSVNDVTEIEVHPLKQNSDILPKLIKNADYLNKAGEFAVPECVIYADKLRLQQTFDNIFMNSYKYADTDIDVSAEIKDDRLYVKIKDHGPGVDPSELPLLKEKFRRGIGTQDKDGAGLGLYLADYFLKAMDGELMLESEDGFGVTLILRIV